MSHSSEFSESFISMVKSIEANLVEKETYESIGGTEQLMGMSCRAFFNRKTERVELRAEMFTGKPVGVRATVTLDEWKNRPAAGRDKTQAKWALGLCKAL